ncbi:MAG: carbohydrate-binding domain-containing protein, partial [Bacteroidales bacterium]|nr:carbohydrate-binding domain-containing protein [Bacteroidales bacterium]
MINILVLSETSTLTDDKAEVVDEAAVIKADNNSVLTIKGDGSLNVKAANNGIASDGSIVISGGIVNVEAGNNGIESDPDYDLSDITNRFAGGTLTITDGEITVNAEDAAIKAASKLTIGINGNSSGPDINVIRSGDGLKAAQIYLYSGKGIIRSSDDGINATYERFISKDESSGGYQSADVLYSAFRGLFGDFLIVFDGGTWYVNADGDGLDSNGGIKMNGGNITVFGSEGNDDAAIDYENVFEINDGQIIAIGTSNMAVYPTKTPEAKSYVVF